MNGMRFVELICYEFILEYNLNLCNSIIEISKKEVGK